jgi:signal transduction histidine kinase
MTITTEIEAPANDQSSHVVVSIADTGCGMTAEAQARIFDPLYTTKERGKGTGLGLAVVNQVMQEHEGAIEVESARGRGSRFRLLFPTLAPHSHGRAGQPTESNGASMKFSLAEDESDETHSCRGR